VKDMGRPGRLDMAGMGLDGMGVGRNGSRYFAFVNIYRHRNAARPGSWVGLSFGHKSIYDERSFHFEHNDSPVRRDPIRPSFLTTRTPPNSFFLTINHPQPSLVFLIIPDRPILDTRIMKGRKTSLIMCRDDFRINDIDPGGEW